MRISPRAMASRSRFIFSFFCASSTLALIVACSANGGGDEILETEDASPTVPASTTPGTKLPPATEAGISPMPDAGNKDGGKKDASGDAAKDATVDAGKPAPNTGDPCPNANELFSRQCGICGTQEALCLPNPDGPGNLVTDYSDCQNELVGGCAPGTSDTEACGNCGTRMRTCTKYCAWTTGACMGEPPMSCTPTTEDYTTAGCPTAGTMRTRSCGGTCTWTNFSPTCDPLNFQLVVAGTPGDSVSAIYPLRATVAAKRMTGTCPNGSFSTTTNHPYVYVELVNPTETTLTLSAWNTVAQTGGPIIDTLMTWYAGNVKPTDEPSRKACAKGVIDSCPTGLPCGDFKWAGVTGTSAIKIPPMSSSIVFFGSYYAAGSGSTAEGPVKLVVRTDTAVEP